MFHFVTKLIHNKLKEHFHQLYLVIYAERDVGAKLRICRSVLSFLLGLFLAYLLWKLVEQSFNLQKIVSLPIFNVFLVINGLAYLLSPSVRSITLLIFVALVGNSGRSYLRAMAFAFIIAGPIDNLATNGEEVVRVFSCTTLLTYNLTKTRFDLMVKPFTQTLAHMKANVTEIQSKFQEIRDILKPLKDEVEGDEIDDNEDETNGTAAGKIDYDYHGVDELVLGEKDICQIKRNLRQSSNDVLPQAEDIQRHFIDKMRKRCLFQLKRAEQHCRNTLNTAHSNCMEKFNRIVGVLLCSIYKMDFVCALSTPDHICNSQVAIPENFGQTYVVLLKREQDLYTNSSDIKLSYKIYNGTMPTALRSAEDTAKDISSEFSSRKHIFDAIMILFEKLMCLFILRIVYASITYFWQYRTNIKFDNCYISHYFKCLDEKRKSEGKFYILPLKSYEKSGFVEVDILCDRTKEESHTAMYHILQLSVEVITVGFFLLLDYLVVELLRTIHSSSKITFTQQGEHDIRFQVEGTGLLARILRVTLLNFNMNTHVSTVLSNEECLPQPHVLPQSFYVKLLLLYLVIIVLIYQGTTFLRLRRIICSYFYCRREKQRILFLYNQMLRSRHAAFDALKKHAEENLALHHVNMKVNIFLYLRLNYQSHFTWLKKFKCARRKCLICNTHEDDNFVICSNIRCGHAFCQDCSLELKGNCIVCNKQFDEFHSL